MKYAVFVLLATGALIGAASAASVGLCDFSFTHFPPGLENANVPEGWTLKKQKKAGNDQPDELLKIALAGYPVPTLQVWPLSYLLNNNTEVPYSCWTPSAAAAVQDGNRRLQQAPKSGAFVVKPATYKVEYTLMNRNRLAGISPNGTLTSPPLSIKLENFGDVVTDGEYCMNIYVTVLAQTAVISADLNATQYKLPSTDLQIKKRVCFVKLSVRPTADVSFGSCNSTFTLKLSSIAPLPVYVRTPDMLLFKTVFHVWGKQNDTLPGAPPQPDTQQDYLDEFLVLDGNKTDSIVYTTSGLKEGIYSFNAEGSIASDYEELVSVAGIDTFADGSTKYMGGELRNGSKWLVYVQNRPSRVFDVTGPTSAPAIGEDATFTWESDGYGDFFCFVDGKRVYNLADKSHCESPLTLKFKDLTNHTLQIVLADVCNKNIKKEINFGAWGWAVNTTGEPPAPPPPHPDAPSEPYNMKAFNYTKKNSAQAASAPSSSAMLTLLAALLAVLAALL